mmetsp:Transcript_31352/g.78549  ORF Transcript_31352/g.78549 Transcript_31352/m.78549 type:complete len:507 (+) Transcript_31352:169-1689(+)
MTRFQPFVLGLAILLMASVVQARVLSCGAGCAVGGRTVCDTYGNYVAPNVCVAMACYGATITGVQYCPDDPVKAQGDTVAEPEPEPVAPVQSGKRAAVRASSDATCEKLCGSAAFRPVCDKDGVFLANNVCEARYCVGVSVSDIRYCPDEVEAAIMEEAEEMTEDVVERANEVLAEVVREAKQAMQAEPENAEEIAEKAEQIIENVVEQADIVVEMEEEAMPAVKKTAERAEEAVGDMAEAADEMVEEMAEKAEEVAPEVAQMMEAERAVSDETCQALCSNAPTTGRMCDEDGVFVANSLCEARYCAGVASVGQLTLCRDVEEAPAAERMAEESKGQAEVTVAKVAEGAEQTMESEAGTAEAEAVGKVDQPIQQAGGEVEETEGAAPSVQGTPDGAEGMVEAIAPEDEQAMEAEPEAEPSVQSNSGSGRVVSDEACRMLCADAPPTGPLCDGDGVFVGNSLCEARYCAFVTPFTRLTICYGRGSAPPADDQAGQLAEEENSGAGGR